MYNKKLLLSILKSAAEKKEPKLSAKDLEDSNSFMKKGGSLTANLQGTNRLFKKNSLFKKNPLLKKNPLFKKKNYKSKTYSPNAKLYAEGGEPCPDGMVFNEITKNCITLDEHQKFLVDWYENRKMPDPLDQENFQKVQPEILSRVNNFPPYVLSEDLDEGTAGYYDDEEKIIALNKFLPETIQEGSKVHENNHYLTSGAKTIKNFAGPHGYIVEQNIRKPKEINTGNPEWDKNLKNNYEDIVLPDEIQSRLMTFRKLAGFKADQVITEKDVEDYFKSNGDKLDPDIQDIKQITKDTKAVVNLLNGIVSTPVKSKDLQFAENGGITTQEEIDAANTAMMKARLAYANEFGNPAAKRMINLPDEPYQFDNGDTGTHYMASMDNYAVPQIQDENGVLQLGDYGPESNEAIRFDSDEDANYFAEHYKDVSPGFINEKKEGGLHKFVGGGPTDCPEGAEWDDQIQSCICINGMVWEAAENRCVREQAYPSVKINQYTPYVNAWEQMHPVQREMSDKKYEYLQKAPGLNRLFGVTKDNINEKVLRNIAREVERERNNYVITQFAKDNGFNPNDHVQLVENIAEKGQGSYDMAQNSQYGSKLAPSLWARSLAGFQELGNFVVKQLPGEQGDVFKYKVPGLTKKERKEIADSNYGALETASLLNLPGQIIANQVSKYVKPIFGGTGANSRDEDDMPGVLSGQYIPGVGDGLATVLNPFTWTGLTSGLMGLQGAVNTLKLFTNAKVIDDVAPLLTKVDDVTSLNKVDDVLSLQTTNNKVSEINWGNWNKEIPKNKTLMQEYTAIEEASKANGTWMKNADGTPFNGTPEQFVQQQSQNFKKAYPEGTTTTYRGDATHTPTLTNKNSVGNSVFTGEENLAQHYTGNTDYYNSNIFSTENKIIPKDQWNSYSEAMKNSTLSKYGDKLKIVDDASDPGLTPAGMHKLYVKNSDNQVIIDAKNADWHSIENPFPENIRIDKQLGERTKDYAKQGDYVNTDQIARVLEEQGIDKAIINNIQDGKLGDIIINNQKPGNYLKSMMGNNGMFDLTNPNIYKAIIPAVGGTGLMLNNPGVLPQQNKYGGALDKFVGGGKPCPKGMGWSIKDNKCIKLINFTDIKNRVDNITYKPLTKLEDALDDRYKKGPKNSFSDFGKLSTEEKIKLKADNLAYQAQVDAEAARQAAVAAGDSDYFNINTNPSGCYYGFYWNGTNCVPITYDVGNDFLSNTITGVNAKIAAVEKQGMVYQHVADQLKTLYEKKAKIVESDKKYYQQIEKEKLAKEKLLEQERKAKMNPNAYYSETIQEVARNSGGLKTQQEWDGIAEAQTLYHQKRMFITDDYLYTHRDALVHEAARSIRNSFPNLTYDQALAKAEQDEALLYKLAEKHTPTEGSHVDNLAKKLDFYDYKNSRNDQIKSIDPNDPTHISFEDPGTIGGYLDHVKNIVKNPLDATGYAFSDKTMPFNYGAYEEMKEKTGYRDDNDDNVVLQGIDVASWFHPVGLYGQGIKMIEPTEKSIENLYNNPTWENAGTAAFDIGMTGLTFLGAKNPLKFLAEEKFAADAATAFRNWNPAQTGSTPPFNTGTGLLPVGVATEVRAASEAATGSTPLLNEGAIGFNPRIEIEGATVYNQLLEQQRLKNIAEIETPAGFQNRLFDSNIQLGSFEGKGHLSEVGYNYRTLGNEEIKAIQESKGVFPKAGKAKGGNENVKYWTKGNEKNWYAENPNQQVIRVKDNKFSTDKVVNANDVEIFNHKTGNFDPLVKDEVKLVANPKRSQELNSEAFSIYKGDKIVGEISGTTSANGDFIVYDVGVDAQFQKQGIGTEVYKQLNESLAPGNKVKSWGAFVEEAGVAPGRNTWQSLETQGLAKRNEKGIYEMLPKKLQGSPNASSVAEPFEIAKKRILNSSNNFNRIIKTNKTASTEPAYVQQEFAFPVETPIVPKPIGTRLQLNPTVPKIEVPALSAKLTNEQKIMKGMEQASLTGKQTSLASEQANALKASAEIPKTYPIINPDYFTYILSKSNVSKANRKFYTEIIDTVKAQGNVASEAQKNMLERIRSGNFNYNSNVDKLNAGNLNAGNINAGSYADKLREGNKFLKKPLTEREIEMYVYFRELDRFDKLPKTTNKTSLEVLENFKKRIKTSEGKKRMKALGIKNDKQLQKIEIVEDPNSYGYYRPSENKIAINPDLPIPEIVRHEIEHGVGNAVQRQARINQRKLIPFLKQIFTDPFDKKGVLDKIERGITEIDDLLSGLELRKEVTPNKIWKSNVINEKPVDTNLFDPAIADKQLATDYFATGSEGREKATFLAEVQEYMMKTGRIPKTSYVEITPEMVKQTMVDAMFDEVGRGKYLRLFNIMNPTAANYKLVAKGLNKMLGIAPLIGVGVGLGFGAASQVPEKKHGGLHKFVGGGEAPSTVWRQYTGTSWSEAKKQGLTDGSAKANLALRDRLLAGEFGEAKMSNEEVAARSDAYKNMVGRMISRGATLEELVARRIGTKEGLTNMFSELSTPVKEDLSKYAAQIKPKGIPLPIVFPKQIEKKIETIVKEDLKKYAATIAPKGIPLPKVFPKQIEKSKPLTTLNDAFDLKFKKFAPLKSFSNFGKDKPIVVSKIKKETPVAPTNDVASWIKNEQRPGPNIFKQSIAPVVPKVNTKSNFEKDLLNRLTTIAKQKALLKPEPISKVEPIPNSMAAQFSRQDFNKKYYDANGKEIKPILWDPDHTSGSDPNYKVRLEKEKARLAAEKAFIPVFDNSISTQLVDQELYGRQKQDNERYGKFMKRGKDIANRTDVQRNIDSEQFFADIAKPNSVIIDIGSALGNSNSKLAGVSVWELTQNPKIKQKKIKVIATDLPDQVESFKEHIKNKKAYNIDYAEVPMTFNTPIYDVLKTKNLGSTKDVYLRAANSIDLLMTVAQTKEHFYNIAKSLKDKNVTYVYNNIIFYKASGETYWKKIGNINNAAFDHNSASWKTNKNRKPYALINDETGVKNPFDN